MRRREAPSLHPHYQFMPIAPEWRLEERDLKRRPDAFEVIRQEDPDPNFKGYFRELRYYRADAAGCTLEELGVAALFARGA